MTRKQIIVSVPHTGTRFLKQHLDLQHVHTSVEWFKLLKAVDKMEHIHCPLRPTKEVWASWCRRRSRQDPLKILNDFWHAYANLHALNARYPIIFHNVTEISGERLGEDEHQGKVWKLHKVDLRPFDDLPFLKGRFDD